MAVLNGGSASDTIFGTRYDDTINGYAGNDILIGEDGYDDINGGSGDDVIDGGDNPDYLMGGDGNDIIVGGNAGDTIYGDTAGQGGSGGGNTQDVTTSNSTTIPGTGQGFSVTMTVPDASGSSTYDVDGLVSTSAVTTRNVNVAIAIDVSGSTGSTYSGTPVGDLNGNGRANEIIDGEIAGTLSLLQSIRDAGFGFANVQIITFDSSVDETRNFTINGDADGNGTPDVEDFVTTLVALGGTNYEPPMDEAIDYFNTRTWGSNYLFFMSDGVPSSSTNYADEVTTLIDPAGLDVEIRAFPIGTGAREQPLDLLDDGVDNNSAPVVSDPGALTAALTGGGITPADVQEVQIYVNGALVDTIPSSALISTPFGLSYNSTLTGLSIPNAETVRVVAVASDGTTVATSQVVEALSTDGDDLIFGGAGSDDLHGEGGNDSIFGGSADDEIYGDDGDDLLGGGEGDDLLIGAAGNDEAWGGSGDDQAYTGLGDDTAGGGFGDDSLYTSDGADVLYGGDGDDVLGGGSQNDELYGGDGNDALYAGDGEDELWGGAGADDLWAGVGDDILNGGTGNDSMFGGIGADEFEYAAGLGNDLIRDFTDNVDTLVLDSNLWTGTLTAAQVVSNFATPSGGNTVFDFGGGNVITLQGVVAPSAVIDDIVIV